MNGIPLRRVCVWFDGFAPEHGVFMQALSWADRLEVPLSGRFPEESTRDGQRPSNWPAAGCADWLSACERICRRTGVAGEAPADSAERLGEVEGSTLHVVSGILPDTAKK